MSTSKVSKYKDQLTSNKYIDIKSNNGRLFPTWIMANFKQFKIPEFKMVDGDPCNQQKKFELRKYQEFAAKYLDYNSPYKNILLYHGLGSGKTISTINIYNMLYSYDNGWNVFILLKASLKDDPWLKDLEKMFNNDKEKENKMKNIFFISYDSPIADKKFLEITSNVDTSKKSLYIIEEAHLFMSNVYTNINSRQGKRALTIYEHILNDKKQNDTTRVLLLSGTPAVNYPYEIALMLNLLRPGCMPKSENEFNRLFVDEKNRVINPATKNMFQRRILGLISYYLGATPDLFATKKEEYVDVIMSEYQEEIYNYYEEKEEKLAMKKKLSGNSSQSYKSYTRQACNFVFPNITEKVNGRDRPRPNKFKISESKALNILEGLVNEVKSNPKLMQVEAYLEELNLYINSFDDYLEKQKNKDIKYTIADDFKKYVEVYNRDYNRFITEEKEKSNLLTAMYNCSSKILCMIFKMLESKGPILVHSNYVKMEGFDIIKIYLKYFGFTKFTDLKEGTDHFRYTEFTGELSMDERKLNKNVFNSKSNMYGKDIKIIMISPAGAEGIELSNVRQVHLLEPYWNESRMNQMIGRARRQCKHSDLPMEERHIDVYRYKSIRNNSLKQTTDQYIESLARKKQSFIESFLETMKEAAIDCELYKEINKLGFNYKCFQFDEGDLFQENIPPSYKENFQDDLQYNSGLNNPDSIIKRVKLIKIKARLLLSTPENDNIIITKDTKLSSEKNYWFNKETGVVYDYDHKYVIGKVGFNNNIPIMLEDGSYLITYSIPIPLI